MINIDILYNKQFGFRFSHSTEQAILSTTDNIQKAIEDKKFSCGTFLDLSKAFDSVNHDVLIMKLDHYGIRGIAKEWFISYCSERKQFVSLGNIKSNSLNISCGVPQGSVLGTLLFLLYINDFQNLSNLLDFHIFADDANLFHADSSLFKLEQTVNTQLNYVYEWLCVSYH